MANITHDDLVRVVLINSKTASEDRASILETGVDTNIVTVSFIEPTEELPNYGDCSVVGKNDENDFSVGCNVNLVALFKGTLLPDAIRLALKEALIYLNKNKVKIDIVYVTDSGCRMNKLQFASFALILQNIMKDNKCNASLWLEHIERDEMKCVSMDMEFHKKDKKEKDKKKKKKKKGKK